MGLEIERKFLLANSDWRNLVRNSKTIRQGYLNSSVERTVRVRTIGKQGIITIKGKNIGLSRPEFEYEIPVKDANELLEMCETAIIEKTRFELSIDGKNWEIDEFEGVNQGLIVAEIELKSENEVIDIPKWIGKEVSSEAKYYNSSLIKKPYKDWKK